MSSRKEKSRAEEFAEHQKEYGAKFQWYNHPRMMAGLYGLPPLYPWQSDFLTEASEQKSRVVGTFCNEGGKTNILIPALGLSVMAAFPGATVFSTAGVNEQIEGQLFNYLDGMVRPWRKYGWDISTKGLTVTSPRINGLRSRWIGRVPREALTMEGYHGTIKKDESGIWRYCPICLIFDEGKSLGEPELEAAFRINPDFFLMVSSPGPDEGMLFNAMDPDNLPADHTFKRAPGGDELFSYRRMISWLDCPHLCTGNNLRENERLIKKYGIDSSYIRSKLLGQFATDDTENRVFHEADIRNLRYAMNLPEDEKVPHGTMAAAVDVSGGGDEQVLAIRCGGEVVYYSQQRTKDTIDMARRWVQTLKEFNVRPQECIGDSGGGYGEILKMMEDNDYRGIRRYMNNQQPRNGREYYDRITEDTYRFKELLRAGGIKLPADNELVAQARRRLFETRDSTQARGKVKLEQKGKHRQRHGSSPDRLETMVMLYSNYNQVAAPKEEKPYVSPLEKRAREMADTQSFGGLRTQPDLAQVLAQARAEPHVGEVKLR